MIDWPMKFPLQIEILTATKPTETPTQLLIRLNSLISKLTYSHQFSQALQLFHQIHSSHHLKPDHYTLASTLTACANLHDTLTGDQIHAHVVRSGFKSYSHIHNTLLFLYSRSNNLNSVNQLFGEISVPDVYSWTTLLSAYTKSGRIDHACRIFDQTPQRDVAVWNAVITGCVENGHRDIAFKMFNRMHQASVRHDRFTFASVLSFCSWPELLDFGRQVHSLAIRTGFLVEVSVINAQITMYFNCGVVSEAYKVFEEAKVITCNGITFNAMIAGLASMGRDAEALMMLREMREACFEPNELTFVSVLSSCSSGRMVKVGQQVHVQAIKMGFEDCTSVSNAAITMYSNCGDLSASCLVFETLKEKDLVSWNSIITGYAQANYCRLAITAFLQMQMAGIKPDDFTIGPLLVCLELGIIEMILALVLQNGLILITEVSNALVSAFYKHGKVEHACQIFDSMPSRNLISWNSIISGFLFNGLPMKGLEIFSKFQVSGLNPNSYTLSIILSICASISALRLGQQVHGYILRSGFDVETSLGNALITMYAKCGLLDWSSKVFGGISDKDVVSWNAMISAYAQHGEGKKAIRCFEIMLELGLIKPDQATFTAVLSACSHAGLVDEGRQIFSSMVEDYCIEPEMDQYSCIIDLLGRAGHLDEAERLITSMPFKADSTIWWAVLSACTAHGNVRLGRVAAEFLFDSEPDNPAVYVLLSNLYATSGQWEEAANVRELMMKNGITKQPGCSWIESHNHVHTFMLDDRQWNSKPSSF